MATATIVGNITDDPELKFTPSGAAVANFTVAENRRRFNRDRNEWEDVGTDYYRCAVWRESAENVAETLVKGMRVIVTGETRQEVFERKDGSKGMAVEMNVAEVGPSLRWASASVTRRTGGGNSGGGNGWGGGAQAAAPAPAGNPWDGQQAAPQQTAPAGGGWGRGPQGGDQPPF